MRLEDYWYFAQLAKEGIASVDIDLVKPALLVHSGSKARIGVKVALSHTTDRAPGRAVGTTNELVTTTDSEDRHWSGSNCVDQPCQPCAVVLAPIGGAAAYHHRARSQTPDSVERHLFEPDDVARLSCRRFQASPGGIEPRPMRRARHRVLNDPAMLEIDIDYSHQSSHQGERLPWQTQCAAFCSMRRRRCFLLIPELSSPCSVQSRIIEQST
jgi:hypothetical protein